MPGYLTKQEAVAIGGVADLQVRSLLDRLQYADPQGLAAALGISSAAWPLFGLAWPSGVALAARLALRPVQAGERILEVGCGLALAALVAHRRGADITASDWHPLAEAFLAENLRLNGLPPLRYRHGDWGAVPGVVPSRPYGLIVGSDVLYDRDASVALAGFIGRHALPAAEVWIVDPDRGNRGGFGRAMHTLGFGLAEERLDSAAYKGRLMVFTRA